MRAGFRAGNRLKMRSTDVGLRAGAEFISVGLKAGTRVFARGILILRHKKKKPSLLFSLRSAKPYKKL